MREQKKIFVTHITDNGLLPRIYNKFIQIHQKKTTQQENEERMLMDNFREEKLQIANKYKTCKIPNCQGNTNQVCEFEKKSLKLDNIKYYCNCYKN